MFAALLLSVTSWYRQESRGPEGSRDLHLSGQDTASEALSSCAISTAPRWILESFQPGQREAPNSVCQGESLGLLVRYSLRLLVM